MIVFKTYFKILKRYKGTVLLYTSILLFFGVWNMRSNEESMSFSPQKPDICIVNHDDEKGLTEHLISYLQDHCTVVPLSDEQSIDDAIFYRDVHYVIYIPKNYHQDVLAGQNPVLAIKSTGDYSASLTERILERYLQIQKVMIQNLTAENEIIESMDQVLETETTIQMAEEQTGTSQSAFYFNFASYSIMSCIVFIVCLIMTSFKNKNTQQRTVVTPLPYQSYNYQLLLANSLYALTLWLFYVATAVILTGHELLSVKGLLYCSNLLLFSICSLTISLLLSTLLNDKNVVSGIANVIALGSAFLSGVFVPVSLLPDFVLKIAHLLPSYWFVNTNEVLKNATELNRVTLRPVLINMAVLVGFMIIFIFANNVITKRKQIFA